MRLLVLWLAFGLLAGLSSEAEAQNPDLERPSIRLERAGTSSLNIRYSIQSPPPGGFQFEITRATDFFGGFVRIHLGPQSPALFGAHVTSPEGNGSNFYRVRVRLIDGTEGPWSEIVIASVGPTLEPSMVQDLRTSFNSFFRRVQLNWRAPFLTGDFYFAPNGGYQVFRRDSGGSFQLISGSDNLSPSSPLYIDQMVRPTSYDYRVVAINSVGASIAAEASITIPNPTTPVANAGADQTVAEDVSVMLDGRGSTDADIGDIGDVLSYRWEQVDGPTVQLTDSTTATPTFTTPILPDSNMEELRFQLTVTDLGDNSSTDEVTITVLNDSPTAHLSITHNSRFGREGGRFNVIATLDRAFPEELRFNWETLDGSEATPALLQFLGRSVAGPLSAVDGLDYEGASGSLVFPPLQTQASFEVDIIDDDIFEGVEFFTLRLSEVATDPLPAGVTFTRFTRAILLDNEPITVLVSIADVEATEGDDIIFSVDFDPQLFTGSLFEVRFEWSTADGTAMTNNATVLAGRDYLPTNGEDRFPAGASSFLITVPGREDNIVERDETFTLTFTAIDDLPDTVSFAGDPMNLNMTQAIGRILDDDSAVIHIADASAQEGMDLVFPITMSQRVAEAVQVDWSIEPSSAQVREGEDYQGSSGSIMIPAGETTATVRVPSLEDTLFEVDESFVVTLSLPDDFNGALSIGSAATGIIEDNDGMRVAIADATVTEGGTLSFAVSLSQAALEDVVFNVATEGGTATAGDDYTAVTNSVLTIPTGARGATVTVMSIEDTLIEGNEDFTVRLSAVGDLPDRVFLGDDTAIGTIEDNDVAVVSIANARAVEGSALSFAVSLEQPAAADVMFNWSTSDGTAMLADADYRAVTNRVLTIPAGAGSAAITVMSIADTRVEEDEDFTVELLSTIGSGPIVTFNNTTAMGIIENDDTAIIVIEDATATEGGDLVFAVRLTQAAEVDIGLTWSTSGGTATAGADYRPATDVALTIPAGAMEAAIIVTSREDTLIEGNENFTVTLSVTTTLPSGVTLPDSTATGTIEENDTTTVTINDATALEGEDLVFAVRLTQAAAVDIGLTWSTRDGSATAGDDYRAVTNRVLTIPAGATEVMITVTSLTDTLIEGEEDFTVTLSAPANLPSGVILADPTATGTITSMNRLPTAQFIWPTTVREGETVALDGSGSSDPDGDDGNLSYIWSYLDAEERDTGARVDLDVTFDLTDPVRPTFVAPNVSVATDLIVSLVVRDERGGESRPFTLFPRFAILVLPTDDPTAAIEVSTPHFVIPGTQPPQIPTPSTAVFLEGETVTLDSSGSSDPLGQGLSYQWTVRATGMQVTLIGSQSATATFVTPALPDPGNPRGYIVRLVIKDASDQESQPAVANIQVVSQPMAEAGDSQTVVEGTTVTLNGEGSIGHIDPNTSAPLIYAWVQTGGTPTVDLENADTARATFTAPDGLAPGTVLELAFELTITTEFNVSASDTVAITVVDTVAVTAPDDQTYTIDTAITDLTLPEATGGIGTATYTLTGPGGMALATAVPGLAFDATGRVLSGTPSTPATTTLTYMVTDTNGASTNATFTVTVNAGLTLTALGNQNYTRGTLITDLQLPAATGGTAPLTYTLTSVPGLNFTPGTRTLSGTPSTPATTTLTYTVTDTNGASTNATFTVMVNASLTLTALGNQNYTLDTAITDLQLPAATGGTAPLTYTLTGPGGGNLPAGLNFTPGTRTLSGTPSTADTTTLTYMVTDANNASTSVDFTVMVNASLTLTAPANQNYTLDTAITDLQLPAATGGTAPLTYTLTSVPGLNFTPGTRTLSGTPSTADTTTLTYEVSDTNGASTSVDFMVIVNASLTLTASGNQNYTLDTAITDLQLPAATGGTAPLTYTLTSVPGLNFTPGTRTLSGTPSTADTTTLTYEVTDANNASTTATFTVIVNASLTLTASGNQNYTRGTLITDLQLPVATGGTAPLTYTLTSVPGLNFTPGTRTLSGTPSTAATTTLTYEVTDTNGASTNATFTVIVSDGLALSARGDQNYTRGTLITDLQLPAATGGTGTLTYTLTSVPGLTFTPGTRTLSGTPSTADTTTLTYEVTDANNASTTATFTVIVSDGLALSARGDQNYTQGTLITDLQLPAATGGTGTLTYTLTSVPGLNFTPDTRTLSGTPNTAGTTTLTYEVTDDNNASTSATFTVTVNASLTLTASGNQNYTLDTAIPGLPLPAATGGTAPLTYTLTGPGGSNLPGGLTFTAGTRTLSGTPNTAGTTTLTYEVTDDNGASTNATFTVIVSDGLALTASGNQNYTLDTAITALQLPVATGGTGTLQYTLTGPGGSNLPGGLTFTAGTRTLSGTPNTADTTTLTYRVSDTNGASTSVDFMVTVNASLTLTAPANQNYTRGTLITDLQLPAATGGTGTLTYTLTGPGGGNLPAGLTFTPGTRTLSGTPSTADTTTLTYTVTDTNNASTTATFTVIVNASLTLTASGNQNYTRGTLITDLQLPAATGGTAPLTYTLTSVPGLNFNASTRTLSGTPSTAGTTTLTYEVTDDNGASTNATFTVMVNASLTLTASGNQNYTLDTAITDLQLPVATGGTAPLTYTLTSVPGLNFNASTRTLSGTLSTAGTTTLTYMVTDDNGASTNATFTVTVSDGLALSARGNQNYTLDTAITDLQLPAATGGTGTLTYTLTGPGGGNLPAGLTFTPGTRTLSGTPSTAGTTTLTYEVTDDNGASTNATFTVMVSDGLALSARGNQNYTRGTLITDLQLPVATGGTGTLTYTLTGPGGGNLPAGLTFTPGTRTLSGTPSTADTTTLTYTVTDTNGASTNATFTVMVNASLTLTALGNQNYTRGTLITDLQLPAATGGTGTLVYTLTGPSGGNLPAGLTFTPGTRTLSGTPSTADTTTLTYEVTDTNGASTSVDFTVIVSDGLALSARGDQNYTQGTLINNLQLPVATGGTGTLTYTLTGPGGGNLPAGLNFTPGTRTLSGTPSTADTTTLTYEVTDTNNASTNATFTVMVNASLTLTASGNQNYTRGTLITDLQLPAATGGTAPLTYTLTSVPGLNFTPGTRTLSGTPSTADTTTLTYAVSDTNGASTSVDFMVIVNASLTLTASGNQNYTQGTLITDLQLPAATGGTGTLTYTLTSVPGLNFTPGTRTLSGTPDTADTTTLTYRVSDTNGASTSVDFMVTVNASLTLTAPANQNYTLDTAITDLQLPVATGGTAPLTYTLTSVPGLNFTPGTRTLSGTPSTADTTTLTYMVTDANNASTNATFTVTVNAGLTLTAPANQNYTLDTAITDLQLPAATGGTGTLTYTLTGPGGGNLPAGLTFTPGTRTLSGTPSTADTTTLTYEVTDTNGASTNATFTVMVSDGLALSARGDQNYTRGTLITDLQLPAATGGTGTLTYTLTGPGGGNLPAGLTFTPGTRTLSGTPSTADTTTLTYTVTDTNGASTNATFTVMVNASLTLTASGNQNYTRGTLITDLQLPAATGGTAPLTYTLTSVPGLNFTPGTRTLSGTPSTAGTTTLTYAVSDTNGASTSVDFMVTVNASLTLTAPANQNYTQGTLITDLQLPAATGGTGTLTYTLTSVPGLNFTPGTRTLSGTPDTADTTTLTYAVSDTNGASTSVDFMVTVNASLTLTAPANQNYTRGTLITDLQLPAATGGTGTLTYTLTGPGGGNLPAGLTFTPGTRTLSGTPSTADTTTLTYEVTDTNGASTSVDFTVIVSDGLALTASGNQNYTQGTAINNLQLPVATGGTAPLTYTLTSVPGLTFTPGTRTLSGTPSTADTTTLTYEVTDANNASTNATFTVTVNASLTLTAPANQNYTLDTAITDLQLPAATGGTAPLTYTLTGPGGGNLPAGLSFTAGTRTLSGTPSTADTTTLTYTVSDTNGASAATFTVTVNTGLGLNASGNQNYTRGTLITDLQLPAATGGTGPLTYTLTSVPGLTFTPNTRTLSGTPSTAGTTTLTYMVTDTNGASTSVDFMVTINASLTLTASGNQNYTQGTAINNLQLPVATGGTAPLVYTLTGPGGGNLPAGLTFTPGTRTLSGTPSTPVTTTLTYMVTDTNGASTNATFTVMVNASLTLTASGNQNYTLDTAITDLQLPAATGGTAPLTYTLTGPGGGNLPAGLSFTAGTRTLSGTPTAMETVTATYTAMDTNGASQSATFTITVRRDILPTFATTEFDLPENRDPPQVMLSATDADGATVTLELTSAQDGALFSLEDSLSTGGTTMANLRFIAQPDFENPVDTATPGGDNIYLVEVQASSMNLSGESVTTTETITITITPVDDNDPVLTTTQATYDVPENSTETIVTLAATDADGDTPSFEIVDNAGTSPDRARFTLRASTGVLAFASPQDFEAPNDANTDRMYQITVQATSTSTPGSGSGSPSRTSNPLALAIRLTAIDEADPSIAPAQATYFFRTGTTGPIATFTIEDDDAGETRTFSALEAAPSSSTNLANFSFDTASGVLSFQGAAATAISALIIRGTSNTKPAMLAITLTVDNRDTPPVFVATTFSQAENATPTFTLTATEADGDDVSFTLQSGGDATYFALTDGGADANTATLTFQAAPDFENAADADGDNAYQVNIRAASTTSTNAEQTMTQIITINVTDADDPPTFTTAADALMIMEGETALTVMLEVIDQDGDTLTLTPTGGADRARLRLTGNVLSFAAAPDFEAPADADANNIYEVEITASSGTGATVLSAVRTFNIAVTDVDDNAPELTSATTYQVQSGETAVATLEATDADAGDTETIVFAPSGGADQAQFTLTSAGVLSFTSPADFTEPTDADADNIYAIEITLTSGSRPHMTEVALEIEVINIDRESRQRIGNVILAHIVRSLADNTQDVILARTSGRLTNNLELSNRQGDLDDLIKGIQGFSFMQRLDAKQAATDAQTKARGFTFWAKGRIRTFSASPNETAINNFSGNTYNLNLGIDYQTGALLFGGLITASQSNVKFTSGSVEGQGKIRTKLTTFAPFMHFRLKGGTEFWGSASFGQGRMRYQSEITTDGGFERTDLKYSQFAGGLYQPLKVLKKTNLALRVDGYTARLKAEAREDIFLAMAGDVSRVRALLEVGRDWEGAYYTLTSKLNGGARLERGDIGKGIGFEFGVEIDYVNPACGFSLSADINAILLHTAQKYRHLDAGVRFLLDPGAKKRGLQLRLEPRIGGSATPVVPLWDGTLVDGSASSDQQLGTSGLGQLQTALGLSYGFAARQSLLTPFTEMRLDDRGAPIDLMLGMRFSRANLPINITLYTQKVLGTAPGATPGVHLKLNWR